MTRQKINRTITLTKVEYEYTCDICGNKVDYLTRCHICGRDMCNACNESIVDCSHKGWEEYMNDEHSEGFCKECAVIGMDCIHAMKANDICYTKYVKYYIRKWKQDVHKV